MAIKQLRLFLSIAALITWISAQAQTIEPVDSKDLTLKNYSTSWIGNDGGYEEVHIPHDMWNIYTNNDGIVATICGWDEGGTNVGVYPVSYTHLGMPRKALPARGQAWPRPPSWAWARRCR